MDMVQHVKPALRHIGHYIYRNRSAFGIILALAVAASVWSFVTTPYIKDYPCWTTLSIHAPLTSKTFPYHINCDSPGFLAAGQTFPDSFRTDTERMSRPGYPLLEKVLDSAGWHVGLKNQFYVELYGAAFINFLSALSAAIILYYLASEFFDKRVGLGSAVLLLLSTHFHVFLGQAHTEIAGDFVTIAGLLLLYLYSKKPSTRLLVVFSLLAGFLMLIKFVFALPIFIALLAIYLRKIRELVLCAVVLVIPTLCWYLYVTHVLHLHFISAEVAWYQQGTWFLYLLPHVKHYYILPYAYLLTVYLFLIDTLVAFVGVPVALAVYGFKRWQYKQKYLVVFGFSISLTLMLYAMLWGGARFAFGLYPVMLPLAVYGFTELWKKKGPWMLALKLATVAGLFTVIIVSQLNVYQILAHYRYNYDDNHIRHTMGYCNPHIVLTCQ